MGRGDRNLTVHNFVARRTVDSLLRLVHIGTITRLDSHSTATSTVNVRTARGGINSAQIANDRTVDQDGNILQVSSSTLFTSTTRCIVQRGDRSIARTNKAQTISRPGPFIQVKDVELSARTELAGCTSCNIDLSARQQHNVLAQNDLTAALNVNRDIAVDRKHEIGRVHCNRANSHINVSNGYCTARIRLNNQSIRCTVIILHNRRTRQHEHIIVATNEGNQRAIRRAIHINGSIAVLGCAGLNGKRHFNVLHIVLAQRENLSCRSHAGSRVAASEILELEILINFRTTLGSHRTGTGNIAPRVQLTTARDGNIAVFRGQFDPADFAGRRASITACLANLVLCRYTNCTRDRQHGIAIQRQRTISSRSLIFRCISRNRRARRIGIQCICAIKGNQHRNATRDRMGCG